MQLSCGRNLVSAIIELAIFECRTNKSCFASRTNSILHEVAQTNFCLATSDACKISFNRQWRGNTRIYDSFTDVPERKRYISFSDPIAVLLCLNSYYSSPAFQKVIAKVVNIIRKDSSPVELSVDISEHECAGVEAKFAN